MSITSRSRRLRPAAAAPSFSALAAIGATLSEQVCKNQQAVEKSAPAPPSGRSRTSIGRSKSACPERQTMIDANSAAKRYAGEACGRLLARTPQEVAPSATPHEHLERCSHPFDSARIMTGGAAAAGAAAAARRRREQQEEEEMTAYTPQELAEGWEFK